MTNDSDNVNSETNATLLALETILEKRSRKDPELAAKQARLLSMLRQNLSMTQLNGSKPSDAGNV